jgi:hypothetical protein
MDIIAALLSLFPPSASHVIDAVLEIDSRINRNLATDSALAQPPLPFSLQQGLWRPIADELNAASLVVQTEKLRTNLQLCALYLQPW